MDRTADYARCILTVGRGLVSRCRSRGAELDPEGSFRAGCMPLPAATVAACCKGLPLGFSQTTTRFPSPGAEVIPFRFRDVAADALAAISLSGEVRDYGQFPERLPNQGEPLLLPAPVFLPGPIGPLIGEDVPTADDEYAVIFELAKGRVFPCLFAAADSEVLLGTSRTKKHALKSCVPCPLLRFGRGEELVIWFSRGDDRPGADVGGQGARHSLHEVTEPGDGQHVVPDDVGVAEQLPQGEPGEMVEAGVGSLDANAGFSTDEVVQQVLRVRGHGSAFVVVMVALVSVATG